MKATLTLPGVALNGPVTVTSCHWPCDRAAFAVNVPATCLPSTVTVNCGSPFQLSAATRRVRLLVAAVAVVVTGAAAAVRPVVSKVTLPLLSTSATPSTIAPPVSSALAAESVVPPTVRLRT